MTDSVLEILSAISYVLFSIAGGVFVHLYKTVERLREQTERLARDMAGLEGRLRGEFVSHEHFVNEIHRVVDKLDAVAAMVHDIRVIIERKQDR